MTEIVKFMIEGDHSNINTVIESASPADMVIVWTQKSDHRALVALSDNFLGMFCEEDKQKIHVDYLSRVWGWSIRWRMEKGKFYNDDKKFPDHFNYRARLVGLSDLPKIEAAYKAAEKWASECGRQRQWAKSETTPPTPAPASAALPPEQPKPKPDACPVARMEVAARIKEELPASMVLVTAPGVPGGIVALSETFLERFKYSQGVMIGGEELGPKWGSKGLSIFIEDGQWWSNPQEFIGDLPVRVKIVQEPVIKRAEEEFLEAKEHLRRRKKIIVRSWAEFPFSE